MFYRTSEFDAGFGLQPNEIPASAQSERRSQDERASQPATPWTRTLRALRQWGARLSQPQHRHRAAWLMVDGLNDHMARDIGLTRTDLGMLGGDPASSARSRQLDRLR